jgi:dolichyl-phosphate beta-glucosyltransferase
MSLLQYYYMNFKQIFRHFWPFLKYCIVGITGTLIDLLTVIFLVEQFTFSPIWAKGIGFLLAATHNFILNKIWTFQNTSKNYRKLYIKFLIVSGFGITATLLTSALVLLWNFFANNFWTFRSKPRQIEIPKHFDYTYSIIIPAYNEEFRIKSTLLLVHDFLTENNINAEIIVVSDGSSDQTVHVCHGLQKKIPELSVINNYKNHGKGGAIKSGIMKAKGEYLLFIDADNSTPIEELQNLAKHQSPQTLVIGSRYLPQSVIKRRQSWRRVLLGRAANLLIQLFLLPGIQDTQCGFKLMPHAAAKEIFARQKVTRFCFDVEMLTIGKMLDYHIEEVPVAWIDSADSRVRPIKDIVHSLWDLVYIRLNLWSGRYR